MTMEIMTVILGDEWKGIYGELIDVVAHPFKGGIKGE